MWIWVASAKQRSFAMLWNGINLISSNQSLHLNSANKIDLFAIQNAIQYSTCIDRCLFRSTNCTSTALRFLRSRWLCWWMYVECVFQCVGALVCLLYLYTVRSAGRYGGWTNTEVDVTIRWQPYYDSFIITIYVAFSKNRILAHFLILLVLFCFPSSKIDLFLMAEYVVLVAGPGRGGTRGPLSCEKSDTKWPFVGPPSPNFFVVVNECLLICVDLL